VGRPHHGGLGITPGMGVLCGPMLMAFPATSSRSASPSHVFYLYTVIYWDSGFLLASCLVNNFSKEVL